MTSGSAAGLFDSVTVTVGSSRIVNSPFALSGLFAGLSSLVIFLYPSIIGVSVYRDFKSEMHTILYSYPFTKLSIYLQNFSVEYLLFTLLYFNCIRDCSWI